MLVLVAMVVVVVVVHTALVTQVSWVALSVHQGLGAEGARAPAA